MVEEDNNTASCIDKLEESSTVEEDNNAASCIDCDDGSNQGNAVAVSPTSKGDYGLVEEVATTEAVEASCSNDEEAFLSASDSDDGDEVISTTLQSNESLFNKNVMPDQALEYRNVVLMELVGVKFLKFMAWTVIGIVLMHYLVQGLDWERDEKYTLTDMILYDGNIIILDMVVFFVMSRLYRQRGIDTASWILTAWISAICTSWETTFKFLQVSVSLYQMHCVWSWKLWTFGILLIPFVGFIVWYHIIYSIRRGILVRKVMEFIMCIIFFLVPYASHPNFHLHHWYIGFVLGMQCNLDVWWSRLTMAWLWGFYINGIAVYGRDPILTCAYSFYQSTDQKCPYMECYRPDLDTNETVSDYKPMPEPNWRNCTGPYE